MVHSPPEPDTQRVLQKGLLNSREASASNFPRNGMTTRSWLMAETGTGRSYCGSRIPAVGQTETMEIAASTFYRPPATERPGGAGALSAASTTQSQRGRRAAGERVPAPGAHRAGRSASVRAAPAAHPPYRSQTPRAVCRDAQGSGAPISAPHAPRRWTQQPEEAAAARALFRRGTKSSRWPHLHPAGHLERAPTAPPARAERSARRGPRPEQLRRGARAEGAEAAAAPVSSPSQRGGTRTPGRGRSRTRLLREGPAGGDAPGEPGARPPRPSPPAAHRPAAAEPARTPPGPARPAASPGCCPELVPRPAVLGGGGFMLDMPVDSQVEVASKQAGLELTGESARFTDT
ncbi:translation initiation factor IF-2-like [Marmota marmota marmota]|uniref:translation initiation factor IF-2-like n=1 Tax=Marmota marmota marmota TaxID=9994 RepID=UPI002092A953|nr:translation initiation factor IF-2-like [Marmota marmota marmota]